MSAGDVEADLELVRATDPSAGRIWLISFNTLTKAPELYDQVEARRCRDAIAIGTDGEASTGTARRCGNGLALLLLIPVAAAAAWLLPVLHCKFLCECGRGKRGHAGELVQWRSVSGSSLAACGCDRSPDSGDLPWLAAAPAALTTATNWLQLAVIVGFNWIQWRVIRWFRAARERPRCSPAVTGQRVR